MLAAAAGGGEGPQTGASSSGSIHSDHGQGVLEPAGISTQGLTDKLSVILPLLNIALILNYVTWLY